MASGELAKEVAALKAKEGKPIVAHRGRHIRPQPDYQGIPTRLDSPDLSAGVMGGDAMPQYLVAIHFPEGYWGRKATVACRAPVEVRPFY